MVLQMPRMVQIRDVRLNVIFYTMEFITGSLLVLYIVHNQLWFSVHKIVDKDIKVSPYSIPLSDSKLQEIMEQRNNSPLCATPEDFWYDWDSTFKYRPTGCLWVCLEEQSNKTSYDGPQPCTAQGDLYNIVEDHLHITTMRYIVHTDSSGVQTSSFLFSPYAEFLEVAFVYSVSTPAPRWGFTRTHTTNKAGHSNRGIITVVYGSNGRIDSVWNRSASLTVSRILNLAGVPENFLDRSLPAHDPNTNASQKRLHPIGRVTGSVISVLIDCKESGDERAQEMLTKRRIEPSVKVSFWCGLKFEVQNQRQWGEIVTSQGFSNQGAYFQHDMGLEFVFIAGGITYYFDPVDFFMMFTSIIILMEIPRSIILSFVSFCLGNLSKIYRRYLICDVSISNALVGNAARLLVKADRFRKIARFCKTEEVEILPLLAAELRGVASDQNKSDKLDTVAFAEFVSLTLANMRDIATQGPLGICGMQRALKKDQPNMENEAIIIDLLHAASDDTQWRTFQDAVEVFGVDRRIGLLERFFQPRFLHTTSQCHKQDAPIDSQETKDRYMPTFSMPELPTCPSANHQTMEAKYSDLGLEKRMEQHRAELEEKIQDLREMMKTIFQRLTRLEASSMIHGSGIMSRSIDIGDSIKLVESASGAQITEQPQFPPVSSVIESLEVDLHHVQIQSRLLAASCDSTQLPNGKEHASLAAAVVGAEQQPTCPSSLSPADSPPPTLSPGRHAFSRQGSNDANSQREALTTADLHNRTSKRGRKRRSTSKSVRSPRGGRAASAMAVSCSNVLPADC
eukprot:TRINITY_DN4075_c0_g1_i7.p1 TRINITY_DN4075_c0_g1~~TRINITY_DN4075_c0_g1_i7.p1  ORF type:complete len:793 (-),score=74.89 TRINITY_DN4075_c0_g1_i7:257-2635(-)